MAEPFEFSVKTDNANALLLQIGIQLLASVDALAALSSEILAHLSERDAGEIADRYEALAHDFALRYAFRLQDDSAPPS